MPISFAKHQAVLMLEDAGLLDRRVAQLQEAGPLRAAAESVVHAGFVQVGQAAALHERGDATRTAKGARGAWRACCRRETPSGAAR
jgi:hypothetical protein